MEYAQLNHDPDPHSDHGNHGDHSVQDDYIDEIDIDSVHIDTVDHGKWKHQEEYLFLDSSGSLMQLESSRSPEWP